MRYVMRQKRLLNWSPTYELWREAELLAVVKRELFSFIHHRFSSRRPDLPLWHSRERQLLVS